MGFLCEADPKGSKVQLKHAKPTKPYTHRFFFSLLAVWERKRHGTAKPLPITYAMNHKTGFDLDFFLRLRVERNRCSSSENYDIDLPAFPRLALF